MQNKNMCFFLVRIKQYFVMIKQTSTRLSKSVIEIINYMRIRVQKYVRKINYS